MSVRTKSARVGRETSQSALREIVAVVYIRPYASSDRLGRIRRFLREHAQGHYRFGNLYQYPMIEFDQISDLTAIRQKFGRLIDGYKDLSDSPEPAD
jgi:hypothetical protein